MLPAAAPSQSVPEFSAGRPGQVETISVIHKGYFQFESNFTPTYGGGVIMFRTGLNRKLESRFTLDDLLSESSSTLGGITAGLLMQIREDKGKWPGMGLAISLSVPNAGGLQMDAGQVDFVIPFSKGFTDELFLDWHLAVSYPADELAFSFASLLGYGITERLGTFVGLYSGNLADGLSETSISMDAGFTYMFRDNIQLDLNGGIPVSDKGEDPFIDIGLVFRLPK